MSDVPPPTTASVAPWRALLRHLVLGVAIANVLHLVAWAELFAAWQAQSYYLKLSRADFVAVPLTVLALGAVFGALLAAASHLGRPRSGVAKTFAVTRVVLAPFVVVTFVRALFSAVAFDVDARFADLAPPLSAIEGLTPRPGPQLVVLLFDAMGEPVTFEKRPAGVELPAFDRLRAGSIAATNVRKAGGRTRTAVPRFLSGPMLTTKPAGPGDLRVDLPDGSDHPWSELPNVFRDARELGGTAIVAGWYHPYCRVFAKDLDACSWYPTANSGGRVEDGFVASLGWSLRSANPLLVYRDRHLRAHHVLLRDAKAATSRRSAGITFAHLPSSHLPLIYDRHAGRTTLLNVSGRGYEDMLVLADRTLADLRTSMEAAGTWEESTVIVTSDHPAGIANRGEGIRKDARVPYLLKMPQASEGRLWEVPVSATLLGRPLIRAVLAGEIRTEAEAITWLDRNAAESTLSTRAP